jgi:septal ring factor EnvC (AmiA/AmiB activator)
LGATSSERRTASQRLAKEGAPDGSLDKAETALRAAEDRTVTLRAALAETDADIVSIDKQIADAADLKSRIETVAKINKLISELQSSGKSMDGSAANLTECTARAAEFSFSASGLNSFAMRVRVEMPDAIRLISEDLRFSAVQILNGKVMASSSLSLPLIEGELR